MVQKGLRLTAVVLVSAFGLALAYSVYKFPRLDNEPFYSGCKKVWAHRGDTRQNPENSVGSLKAAFDNGAAGVELDIHYDSARQIFVVAHDDPASSTTELLLEEVLAAVGSRGGFWLDYKNLKKLRFTEARESAGVLAALLAKYGAKRAAIVESVDPWNLSAVSRAGIATSLWVTPPHDEKPVRQWIDVSLTRMSMVFGGFSAISMDYRHYGGNVKSSFNSAPVHLFTVNEPHELEMLAREPNVHIILSDNPPYDSKSCTERRTLVPNA